MRWTLILLAGAAGATLGGASALAQSSVDRCRTMPTDEERFACLENALAAAEAALGSESAPVNAVAPAPAGEDRDGGFRIPFLGGGDEADAAAPGVAATGLGEEQISRTVQVAEGEEPRIPAEVVAYHERVPGQWQFELSNGEVWRQLSGDNTPLALYGRDPLAIELWESWIGGYRMRLIENNRIIQVQRVR